MSTLDLNQQRNIDGNNHCAIKLAVLVLSAICFIVIDKSIIFVCVTYGLALSRKTHLPTVDILEKDVESVCAMLLWWWQQLLVAGGWTVSHEDVVADERWDTIVHGGTAGADSTAP